MMKMMAMKATWLVMPLIQKDFVCVEKGEQMKNSLADLLKNIPQVNSAKAAVYGLDYVFGCAADYLIENGVTIPVRCKDCEFCHYNSSADTYKCTSMNGMYRTVSPDDFCSYGERERNE